MLLDVNDPIQVHLLVETALEDSREYEILSQEEVDDLKKQIVDLKQRIEQIQQQFSIQSKYRDAAISLSKLYSSQYSSKSSDGPDKRSRKSLMGHKKNNPSLEDADAERSLSEKRCEALAAELWSLEKKLIEPQSRLLKHTAGILQMTHKGPAKTPDPGAMQLGALPGSPESIYTYSNSRNPMEQHRQSDEFSFDERSLYKAAGRWMDGFDDYGSGYGSGSHSRKESRDHIQRFSSSDPKTSSKDHTQKLAATEQKLEDLNTRLRDVIIKTNPQQGSALDLPPLSKTNGEGRPTEAGETLQSHLDYLEKGISLIDQGHNQAARQLEESESRFEETIEGLNHEVHNLLLPYNSGHPEPPVPTGNGTREQLRYFEQSLGAMEAELSRSGKNSGAQGSIEQMETVMMGLWDIIQSGEEEIRRNKSERKKARSAQGLPEEDGEVSDDEESDPNEQFSLQGFSAKVQWLYSKATYLKEQKKVLQRQIKQQRELNSKSDATKDSEIAKTVEELERVKNLLTQTEMNGDATREQLSIVMEKLDEARNQERLRSHDESSAARATQQELEARDATIAELEEKLEEIKDDHSMHSAEIQSRITDSEAKIKSLMVELEAAASAQANQEAVILEREKEIDEKEKEMEEMNHRLARLQTEVTIARAELDGAYGTRAQRAAEVAANPAIQKEIDDLTKSNATLAAELAQLKVQGPGLDERTRTLKKELQETIEEYEIMAKASIEWEKERENLEGTIDKLRDERESLESQLSDEKVRWLGVSSPGPEGVPPAAGSTSTTVLKNEFKKMMRDTRAENQKALRVCYSANFNLRDYFLLNTS
jgi:hypothetical protein